MPEVGLFELCGARPVTPLGVEDIGGWRLKMYGVAYGRERPRPELVEASLAVAAERLPQQPRSD
jgi:hypothetical protein